MDNLVIGLGIIAVGGTIYFLFNSAWGPAAGCAVIWFVCFLLSR